MDERWVASLNRGQTEAAWDAFIGLYRRLIFAGIRHYARDYDDVMEIFARVCEALREDDCRRLRAWVEAPVHRARFSTWLVTVVRHLTVDWFRRRDGRRRLPALAAHLSPLQQRIFDYVFLKGHPHVEAFEMLRTGEAPDLTFRDFQRELRGVYRAASTGRAGAILPGLVQAPPPDVPDDDATPERLALLEGGLATLAAEDRAVVELYVMEELPATEVARIVGLPNAKAVYNRAYRVLKAMREHLEASGIRRDDL